MSKFTIKKLSHNQKALRRRVLEISHFAHYSHLGSCLSSIDLIDAVYMHKRKDEIFVLSNGHAGVALYVVLEKYGFLNSETIQNLNIHPDRNPSKGLYVSTGSLGHGLPIALGIALSNRKKNVYCMISDGECAEGSIWESFRMASDLELENLVILVNANGWGAYGSINTKKLLKRIKAFGLQVVITNGHNSNLLAKNLKDKKNGPSLTIFAKTTGDQFPFLKGQDAHYYIMTDNDFDLAMKMLV